MDNNEINDIIAIFMGAEKCTSQRRDTLHFYRFQTCIKYAWQLEYHSSWGALMEVWHRFRDLKIKDEQYIWACNDIKYMMMEYDEPRPVAIRMMECIKWVNKKLSE